MRPNPNTRRVQYRCTDCGYVFACHAFRPDCPECGAGKRGDPAIEVV